MLNRIVLIGRLTADPELRFAAQTGTAIAKFRIAVDRARLGPNREKETDFINVTVFGKQAENVNQYMRKGRLVAVDGRLQIRNWETQDGQKRQSAEVVAESVRFLERADAGAHEGGSAPGGRSGAGQQEGAGTRRPPGPGYGDAGREPRQDEAPPEKPAPASRQPGPYEELSDEDLDREIYDDEFEDDDPFKV